MSADLTKLRYVRDFAQIPGILYTPERLRVLGSDGHLLYGMVVRIAGHQPKRRDGTYRVELASRYLKEAAGWEYARQKKAKTALVAAIPEAFELIKGDPRTRTGDTLVFKQHVMFDLHNAYVESKKADQDGETCSRDDSTPALETTADLLSKQERICSRNDSKVRVKEIQERNTSSVAGATGKMAKTGKNKGDRQTSPDTMPFVKAWNDNRLQTDGWSWVKSQGTLSKSEREHLTAIVKAHNGDQDAAVASFGRTVRHLAAMASNPNFRFWGDRTKRPGISNFLPNYGKWADQAADAPMAAVNARPKYDSFELDDEVI